jgi:hypothetical protein
VGDEEADIDRMGLAQVRRRLDFLAELRLGGALGSDDHQSWLRLVRREDELLASQGVHRGEDDESLGGPPQRHPQRAWSTDSGNSEIL